MGAGCGVAGTGWGVVGAGCGVAGTGWGVVGAGCGVAGTGWGVVGTGCGVAGTGWGVVDEELACIFAFTAEDEEGRWKKVQTPITKAVTARHASAIIAPFRNTARNRSASFVRSIARS